MKRQRAFQLAAMAAFVLLVGCMDRISGLCELCIVEKYCRLRGDTMMKVAVVNKEGIATRCDVVLRDRDWCDTVTHAPVAWPSCVVGQPYVRE